MDSFANPHPPGEDLFTNPRIRVNLLDLTLTERFPYTTPAWLAGSSGDHVRSGQGRADAKIRLPFGLDLLLPVRPRHRVTLMAEGVAS